MKYPLIFYCLFLSISLSCSRKDKEIKPPAINYDSGAVVLEGDCPSKEYFMKMKNPENTYVLELHHKECKDFLERHAWYFDMAGLEKSIAKRKWTVVRELSDCALRYKPIDSCVRDVMIESVKSRWSSPQPDENEVKTIVKVPTGENGEMLTDLYFKERERKNLGEKIAFGLTNLWRPHDISVEAIDWKKACAFTKDDFPDSNPDGRTIQLLSAECLRLTGKWVSSSVQDRSPKTMALTVLAGESIPLFQEAMDEHRKFIQSRPQRGEVLIDLAGRDVSMREGAAQVNGKMDPNEVRTVIEAHRNEVHHCYRKGLLQKDNLAGNVRVVFQINPAGRAQECRIKVNLDVTDVGKCICGRLETWQFPPPDDGRNAKIIFSWTHFSLTAEKRNIKE